MNIDIEIEIEKRRITRLCHFVHTNKLLHILSSEEGIKAVNFIDDDILKQNDLLRLDGKKDFINCSIQYPNFWYYNKIKDNNPIFEDWCILYIDPLVITYDTTEFCSVNAATAHGAYIESGYDAFADMYSNKICVNGKYDRFRPKNKLLNVPTDDQAEVLVYKNIPRKYITGIAFKNEEIAKNKITQWEVMNFPKFNVYIAPDLFCRAVSDKINGGDIPIEYPYEEGK